MFIGNLYWRGYFIEDVHIGGCVTSENGIYRRGHHIRDGVLLERVKSCRTMSTKQVC